MSSVSSTPFVSVVVPVFNGEDFLEECWQSIANQTYRNIEVIFVDDGSTDGSAALLRDIKDRANIIPIKVKVIHKQNGGVATARNAGILNASGEWVAFLDCDDLWNADKLQRQINILRSTSSIEFLGCVRNNEIPFLIFRGRSLIQRSPFEQLISFYPQPSTVVVRRSALIEVGNFDESFRYAEEGDLWLKLSARGRFYVSTDALVTTGRGKANYGDSGLSANLKKMHEGCLQAIENSYNLGLLTSSQYFFGKVFEKIKYLRRLVFVSFRIVK